MFTTMRPTCQPSRNVCNVEPTSSRQSASGRTSPEESSSTVAVTHRILHHALADAARRNLIPSNPAALAAVPKSSAPAPERDAWTAEELRTFLAHIADDRLHALWILYATTGLRRGEACGLKWSDVDPDGAQFVVRRSRVPVGGKGVVESTTKSGRERIVPLSPAAVAALRAHRKRQLEERLAIGDAWTDSGYVFVNADGTPARPDRVTDAFNELVADAELRPIALHGLRHTFVSLGLNSGNVPVVVMQQLVGHAKLETTLGYVHAAPDAHRAAADSVERLILGT